MTIVYHKGKHKSRIIWEKYQRKKSFEHHVRLRDAKRRPSL